MVTMREGSTDEGRAPIDILVVFISYAHASAAHRRDVERLAELLLAEGIDVVLDAWVDRTRRLWPDWARRQIDQSDYVLAIASPAYKAAAHGDVGPDEHRGAQSETLLLQERLQENRPAWRRRILPVVLPGARVTDIPTFLHPNIESHYRVVSLDADGIAGLVDAMRERSAIPSDRVITGGGRRRRWDLDSGVRGKESVVGFGPDDTVVVVDGHGGVRRWSADGTPLPSVPAGPEPIGAAHQALVASRSHRVATMGRGELRIVEIDDSNGGVRRLPPLRFGRDEHLVTSGGEVLATHDAHELTLRRFADGQPAGAVPCPTGLATSAINGDGSVIALATSDAVHIHRPGAPPLVLRTRNHLPHLGFLQRVLPDPGCWLAVSPTGSHVACATFAEVVVWNVAEEHETFRRALGARESRDGLGATQMRLVCTDAGVLLWLKRGRLTCPTAGSTGFQFSQAGYLSDVAVSRDGRLLASLAEDGRLVVAPFSLPA
jgi:hypothetical protein